LPSAAQAPATTVPASPDFGIVCNRDICVQTQSINTGNSTAVVAVWANTYCFYGHFEMAIPATGWYQNTHPDTNWCPTQHPKFTVPYYGSGVSYQATAWQCCYGDIGQVNFAIYI
jgi:hypothetical protein